MTGGQSMNETYYATAITLFGKYAKAPEWNIKLGFTVLLTVNDTEFSVSPVLCTGKRTGHTHRGGWALC